MARFAPRRRSSCAQLTLGLLVAAWLAGCSAVVGDAGAGSKLGAKDGAGAGPGSDATGGGAGGGDNTAQAFPDGCPANNKKLPQGTGCTASCANCECTTLNIVCDVSCYQAGSNCMVGVDAAGNATAAPGAVDECQGLSCNPENDTSTTMACTATDCQPPSPPAVIQPPSTLTRVAATGMRVYIDPSSSMQGDQCELAGAAQGFADSVYGGGGGFSIGISNMNPQCMIDQGSGDLLVDAAGQMTVPPSLHDVSGCTVIPSCNTCAGQSTTSNCVGHFTSGTPDAVIVSTASDSAAAQKAAVEKIEQLFVMLNYHDENKYCPGSNVGDDESPERCVTDSIWERQHGNPVFNQCITFSDEKIWGDGSICTVNEARYRLEASDPAKFAAIYGAGFHMPAKVSQATVTGTVCEDNLVAFYSAYLNFHGIQLHSMSAHDRGYIAISKSTGGVAGDIVTGEIYFPTGVTLPAACGDANGDGTPDSKYTTFWNLVAGRTVALSTQVCGQISGTPDPATTKLMFGDCATGREIAGWAFDASTSCIQLPASESGTYGNFSLCPR